MKDWRAPLTVTYLLLFAAAWLLYLPADARMHAPYRGHRIIPANAAPLDEFTSPSGAYSFRKLRTAYAGPAIRIRRASDNLETDINFLGFVPGLGAPWDEAAAVAHCAATTCFGRWWYDQSGNALNLGQATTANQPQLIFNCNNSMPCFRFTASTMKLDTAAITPVSPVSLVAVARRTSGTAANAGLINAASNRLVTQTGPANFVTLAGASGLINRAATEGAWHSVFGVAQGVGSVLNTDGLESTGVITAAVVSAVTTVSGNTATTLDESEVINWSNGYALTPSDRTLLTTNHRSFWGTP